MITVTSIYDWFSLRLSLFVENWRKWPKVFMGSNTVGKTWAILIFAESPLSLTEEASIAYSGYSGLKFTLVHIYINAICSYAAYRHFSPCGCRILLNKSTLKDLVPLRNGPLEKLWGGGGGEFSSCRNFFFVIKFLVWIFFRPLHEYFLGLIGVQEFFFHLIFPCANFFFCTSPAPPYVF